MLGIATGIQPKCEAIGNEDLSDFGESIVGVRISKAQVFLLSLVLGAEILLREGNAKLCEFVIGSGFEVVEFCSQICAVYRDQAEEVLFFGSAMVSEALFEVLGLAYIASCGSDEEIDASRVQLVRETAIGCTQGVEMVVAYDQSQTSIGVLEGHPETKRSFFLSRVDGEFGRIDDSCWQGVVIEWHVRPFERGVGGVE